MTESEGIQIGKRTAAKASAGLLKSILAVLVFSASILVLTIPEDKDAGSISNPVKGQIANQTIYSECEFLSEDFEQTRLARERAVASVPLYYKRMDDASARLARQFQVFFEEIGRRAAAERAKKPYSQPEADKVDNASIYLTVQAIPAPDFEFYRKISEDETWKKDFLQKVNDQILNKGILAKKVQDTLQHGAQILIFDVVEGKIREFSPEPLPKILSETQAGSRAAGFLLPRLPRVAEEERKQFRQRAAQIFSSFLTGGNLMPAEEKTNAVREKRKNEVKPLKRSFHIGDTLIKKQQQLSEEDLLLLSDYKAARQQQEGAKSSWGGKFKNAALCLIFLIFSVLYIAWVHPVLLRDNRKVWLLGCIAMAALLANRIFAGTYRIFCEQGSFTPQLAFLALPLGMASGLISAVCGLRAAFSVGLFVSGVAAVALNNSFQVAVTGLLVSGVAAVAVRNVSDYKKYFTALFLACTVSTLFTGTIFLMDEIAGGEWDVVRNACVLAAATGATTATLALILLFVLETIFDVSSNMTYLASTDRNHPLLKRLQLEAPGTYHHSERVASIGEKAAGLIGANPLQVQACALFHDIGKLSAPGMFTENTAGGNPHQGLSPRESAEIIRKHVSYGLELAKKNKLKRAIRDAIAQHHGTDFISFFYDLAKKNASGGEPPDEQDFRYPGPLPNSREAVVLSIADFAEAVSRSMPGLTEEELRSKLLSILRTREENGQLDQAPVTVAELRTVIDSLVSSLTAMNHIRIAYPSFNREEKKAEQ